jgi:hypothetical protein
VEKEFHSDLSNSLLNWVNIFLLSYRAKAGGEKTHFSTPQSVLGLYGSTGVAIGFSQLDNSLRTTEGVDAIRIDSSLAKDGLEMATELAAKGFARILLWNRTEFETLDASRVANEYVQFDRELIADRKRFSDVASAISRVKESGDTITLSTHISEMESAFTRLQARLDAIEERTSAQLFVSGQSRKGSIWDIKAEPGNTILENVRIIVDESDKRLNQYERNVHRRIDDLIKHQAETDEALQKRISDLTFYLKWLPLILVLATAFAANATAILNFLAVLMKLK